MTKSSFRLSSLHTVQVYPIGLSAGEKLKLTHEIVIQDSDGHPTGKAHRPGEIWTVLPGCLDDLAVIWLAQPDGEEHVWDGSIFDTFERLPSPGRSDLPKNDADS